ncbi:hypothetical protein [Kitasatospora phosalacinea]|uniref:Uncharacterized protein n=1 Tax=Kitasatospora phosalacinea TaxID=2065 RepID=A0A9W6UPA6_9ACTN|nr:hypothetical protein [Kitasatospora phosalacinea]GLW55138.1 hypothetical protein Kpho01_31490 [Kitasatospora phosalacinea]
MERNPTDPGEPEGHEDAELVAARLLAEVAAAKARLAEAARAINEIDRSLAAGPQRTASRPLRDSSPAPGADAE